MNQRINELFEQALDESVPETWTTLDPTQLSRLKEKFAELILKQCLSYIDDSFGDVDYVKFMIKRDFGVE